MVKTALLEEVRRRVSAYGVWVLRTVPTEAEAALAFSALTDLLEPVDVDAIALPDPQRRALRAALLLEWSSTRSSRGRWLPPYGRCWRRW